MFWICSDFSDFFGSFGLFGSFGFFSNFLDFFDFLGFLEFFRNFSEFLEFFWVYEDFMNKKRNLTLKSRIFHSHIRCTDFKSSKKKYLGFFEFFKKNFEDFMNKKGFKH